MKEISKAIIAVMKEVNNIEKNTTVGSGNNAYQAVSDKDVKKAIRDSMIKNGLSILQTGIEGNIKIDRWEEVDPWSKQEPKAMKTKQSVFTDVTTKYLLLHTSGETIELSGYGQGVDTQDKGAGKATTYALKNVLINTFLVPTGEDTDNTHSEDIDVPQRKSVIKKINIDGLMKRLDDGSITASTPEEAVERAKELYEVPDYAAKTIKERYSKEIGL